MEVITIDKAAELIIAAITAIAAGGLLNAPITLFLVSVLKRIIPETAVSAGALQFIVGLGLTALFWLAGAFGKADLFKSVTDFILTSGPALLALLSALTGSSLYYNVAVKSNTGFVGYKRS